jgi:stage V sporulation protein B
MGGMPLKINTRSILYGTFVLTAANIFVRAIGFIYQILLSRILGPEGMGVYQLVLPPYVIALSLATSGIPVAISRLVASRKALEDEIGIKQLMSIALWLNIILSMAITAVMILNLDWLSQVFLKDPRTRGPLLVLFPCITITAIGAMFKGYFYGIKNIHPSALAEIIEQIVRIGVAIFLLFLFNPTRYEEATALIILGTVMGELSSLLYLHTSYHHSIKKLQQPKEAPSVFPVVKNILIIATPITCTRLITTMINSINSILIPQRLMASGMSNSQAVSIFGIISGMALPLLFMPFTFTGALSIVMIPHLSEDLALSNWSAIRANISRAILLTTTIAFPATALLLSLGHPIGVVLYNQPQVGQFLMPLAYSMVFHSLQHTCGAILNGLGKQSRATFNSLIGGLIQVFCTYFLVAKPQFGIYGFIIGFILRSTIVFLLNFTAVLQFTKLHIRWIQWFVKPGFAAMVMGSFSRLTFHFFTKQRFPLVFVLVLSFAIGGVFFLIALYSVDGIPRPKNKKAPITTLFNRSLK